MPSLLEKEGDAIRIFIINPNTSKKMTDHIRNELIRTKRADTELTVVCVERDPGTTESLYDEVIAIPPTLQLLKKANQEGYHAVILACFSAPGLEAAKEISKIPVIGIEESTLYMPSMLGAKFSILTTRKKPVASKRKRVHMR